MMLAASSRKYRRFRTIYAESWQKGQQLVLVPNPHYPGNKPNFKRVSVKIIGESASRRLQLSRGDIDMPMRCRGSTQRPEAGK
ncbi:ABC transporter substrate-binding protein [Escherichia coli]|uniref:ABC transporter substrate-binding protein n=1 Tax=Escherichia coli TaxID=562 RepID=A0A2X1MXT2_ECOLX|nr:ABC transporter substrate-binding protein [Escherichia coli]